MIKLKYEVGNTYLFEFYVAKINTEQEKFAI